MSIEPAKGTVLFGFNDRQVQVSQEAYSIFMAREQDMRQQLADVSNERDIAQRHLERMIEAHDELQVKLNASEARNAGERDRLIDAYEGGYGDGQNNPNGYSSEETRDAYIEEFLAQSAPATGEQGAGV